MEKTIYLRHKIVISSDVLAQEAAGEIVLLNLQSEKYFSLNEVGTRIWQLMQRHDKVGSIYSVMLAEYHVEENLLWEDLLAFLQQLAESEIITLVRENGDD